MTVPTARLQHNKQTNINTHMLSQVLAQHQPQRVWLANISLTPHDGEEPLGPGSVQATAHAVSAMSQLVPLVLDGLSPPGDAGQAWQLWCSNRVSEPVANGHGSADLLKVESMSAWIPKFI